jgi:hypothetical protein
VTVVTHPGGFNHRDNAMTEHSYGRAVLELIRDSAREEDARCDDHQDIAFYSLAFLGSVSHLREEVRSSHGVIQFSTRYPLLRILVAALDKRLLPSGRNRTLVEALTSLIEITEDCLRQDGRDKRLLDALISIKRELAVLMLRLTWLECSCRLRLGASHLAADAGHAPAPTCHSPFWEGHEVWYQQLHHVTRLLLTLIGNPVMPLNRPPFAGAVPGLEASGLVPLARELVRRAQLADVDPSALASVIDAGWDAFAMNTFQKTLLGAYVNRAMNAHDGIDIDWTSIIVAVERSLRGDLTARERKLMEIVGIPGPPTGDDPEKSLAPIGCLVVKIRELSAEMARRLQALRPSDAAAAPGRHGSALPAPPWGWIAATTAPEADRRTSEAPAKRPELVAVPSEKGTERTSNWDRLTDTRELLLAALDALTAKEGNRHFPSHVIARQAGMKNPHQSRYRTELKSMSEKGYCTSSSRGYIRTDKPYPPHV